jgi:rhodanese-related sulfurtransferase
VDVVTAVAKGGDVCFLDVREVTEWDAGHIAGSVHIPIGAIQSRVAELDGDRPIVVVCQIGQRSLLVCRFLAARGFDVHNLDGGLEAWTSAGHPLVAVGETPGRLVDGWARRLTGERMDGGPG